MFNESTGFSDVHIAEPVKKFDYKEHPHALGVHGNLYRFDRVSTQGGLEARKIANDIADHSFRFSITNQGKFLGDVGVGDSDAHIHQHSDYIKIHHSHYSQRPYTIFLRRNGEVLTFQDGRLDIPENVTNIVDITSSTGCHAALRADGELILWGRCHGYHELPVNKTMNWQD